MRIRTLAHVSDLHLGAANRYASIARTVAETLSDTGVDHVVVTGDLTHRGRHDELDAYERAFERLIRERRVTVIPGNHDRLGDDVRDRIMPGERVQIASADGLHIVRVDSTGPHNRRWLQGHGLLTLDDIEAIDAALDAAPADALRVVALHHHVLPLPEESFGESFSNRCGWPFTRELGHGMRLLQRIAERCELVLHGHRHIPSSKLIGETLQVCNAGSSTALGRVRLFAHRDGALCLTPMWLDVTRDTHRARDRGVETFTAPTAHRHGADTHIEDLRAHARGTRFLSRSQVQRSGSPELVYAAQGTARKAPLLARSGAFVRNSAQ